MFTWLKSFLTGQTSTNWRRKRANRAYHKRVRARERELRRTWNHEEVANRYFYWAPYSSERPSKDAIKEFRRKKGR
ncbi:uncharacterized protein N7458_009157 [Penicillium daleae]|uniref:Uncharacterized protein n=1 Tax=Penicillium daleae TaxID=63821 RepID=A0AAD6BZ77_9EURO|nr:uncharacterized protein N7458_009157 [Penicillium daleae]KAJ5438159.1 hypothetical protein N7458_009157 [Penicillium daleae]